MLAITGGLTRTNTIVKSKIVNWNFCLDVSTGEWRLIGVYLFHKHREDPFHQISLRSARVAA